MICDGCKPPHTPEDCVDTAAGRQYPHRVCACQHKPRRSQADPTGMCQCEHEDHEESGTGAHGYLQVPAGTHRAVHVGPICDACADGHLADYLIDKDQS